MAGEVSIEGGISNLKAAQRSLRACLQYLAALEQHLQDQLDAQPEEAQRDEHQHRVTVS